MDFEPKPVLKCSDGFSPTSTPPSTSHLFSSCFPHISNKAHGHDSGKRGTFDAGGLLRSMFGPIVPRYSTAFASGVSPPPNRVSPSQIPNSPSGRMGSPMHAMRSGTSTPHHSGLLRASKGHAMHAFTMMPPDVVGKKKPPGYESDEPTSPEVTCIGKVKKKHYKSTWDALVKDKKKDGKKKKTKGNVKRLSGEMSPMSGEKIRRPADFEVRENAEPSFTAKLSRQRSERRRKLELEGISAEIDLHVSKHEDMHATSAAVSDELCSKLTMENLNERNEEPPRAECECIKEPNIATLGEKQNDVPPPHCLLLMKRGSMNRSAHYAPDTGSVIEKEQTRSSESGA
ncbi:hypothetical protein KP509_39G029700 [Ceratopteris richardii]|nr:hypothetical protein KP509_39G029700 [Ceratopteris richardii]